MKVHPGFADKERMTGRSLAKILIHRQRIVKGAGRELSVKAEFGIDIGVQVQPQSITHAGVLLMGEWSKARGRCRIGPAKDSVKAQPKVSTEAKRANL